MRADGGAPRPLLSICIPTRNRAHYLRDALEALLPSAKELGVEVCISDNVSTDATPALLEEMRARYPASFRSIRQPESLSIDRSMIQALLMGRGEYILPAGDDDVFLPGSLAPVLDGLRKVRPHLMVFQAWHTDAVLNPTHRHLSERFEGYVFNAPAEAFREFWDKLPISSFCMRSEAVTEENLRRFDGTAHAYVGGVWEYLHDLFATGEDVRVLASEPVEILIRRGVKSWVRDSAAIYLVAIPKWFRLLGERYATAPLLAVHLERYFKTFQLFEYRGLSTLDASLVRDAEAYLPKQSARRMGIIARIPPRLAKWIVRRPLSSLSWRLFRAWDRRATLPRKVRVLCVNNLVTCLWMNAYLQQTKRDGEPAFNFVVFCESDVRSNVKHERSALRLPADDADARTIIAARQRVLKDLERKIFRNTSAYADRFTSLIEPIYEGYLAPIHFRLRGILAERSRKRGLFASVREALSAAGIHPGEVTEVFFGNDGIHHYFAHFSPHARLFSFEHGVSDTLASAEFGIRPEPWTGRWKRVLKEKSVYFNSLRNRRDVTVSALGKWITALNPRLPMVTIEEKALRQGAQNACALEKTLFSPEMRGTCVLLLLVPITLIGVSEGDETAYFHALVAHAVEELERLGIAYRTLIVKGREEYVGAFTGVGRSADGTAARKRIVFFKELFPENNNAEIYLDALQPQAIIGCLSSTLFYARRIVPQTRVLSYHEFFLRYTRKEFGKTLDEVETLKDAVYGEARSVPFAPEPLL